MLTSHQSAWARQNLGKKESRANARHACGCLCVWVSAAAAGVLRGAVPRACGRRCGGLRADLCGFVGSWCTRKRNGEKKGEREKEAENAHTLTSWLFWERHTHLTRAHTHPCVWDKTAATLKKPGGPHCGARTGSAPRETKMMCLCVFGERTLSKRRRRRQTKITPPAEGGASQTRGDTEERKRPSSLKSS